MCLCFVSPSCAVSPWSWELCMHPPIKSTVLLLCGPTCSSPLKKRKPWNFEVYSPNKIERQASPAAVTAAAYLCYCCSFTACAVLCCCCVTLIVWVFFVFRLRRFNTIPVVPAVAHKIYVVSYVRKTTVLEKQCGLFSAHTYMYFLRDIGRSFFFLLYMPTRYPGRLQQYII